MQIKFILMSPHSRMFSINRFMLSSIIFGCSSDGIALALSGSIAPQYQVYEQ